MTIEQEIYPEVVNELPNGARVYDWEEDGNQVCTGPTSNKTSETILKIPDSFVNSVDQFVGICLTDFSKDLSSRLQNCCRKHEVYPSCSAAHSTENHPSEVTPVQTASIAMSLSEVAEIFHAEEAADEAIIYTGASRAVIGLERLKAMVRSFPTEIRPRIMRVPSNVVFKFGNSGKLTSEQAVMLPRAQRGWLRVEVVPGQTPFLVSNAILRAMRCIVDVEAEELSFKGSAVKIPLFPVRKNLLGVKIVDLLQLSPASGHETTHIFCANETTRQQEQQAGHETTVSQTSESQQTCVRSNQDKSENRMHEHPLDQGIQKHFDIPKECPVHYQGEKT